MRYELVIYWNKENNSVAVEVPELPGCDPEIMSGAPCFTGTRVPIQNLIDYWKVEIRLTSFSKTFQAFRANRSSPFWRKQKLSFSRPRSSEDTARRVRR